MRIQPAFLVIIGLLLFKVITPVSSYAQANEQTFVYGDPLPDAPELAARGAYQVGVRTLEFVHKEQVDILNSKDGSDPLYDRPLTVEVWSWVRLEMRKDR